MPELDLKASFRLFYFTGIFYNAGKDNVEDFICVRNLKERSVSGNWSRLIFLLREEEEYVTDKKFKYYS